MRKRLWVGVLGVVSTLGAGGAACAQTSSSAPAATPDPVAGTAAPAAPAAAADCSRLKGKSRKECTAAAAAPDASGATPPGKANTPATDDKFAFPEDLSKNGGELQRGTDKTKPGVGDMPTADVPDPPADSLKPLPRSETGAPDGGSPAGPAGSSSSSSSSSGAGDAPPDDDAAPTTAGSDTPVKPGELHDLGRARGDSSQARTKLEATRVEDDLKVGRFYFRDGDYTGATARYKDALLHDPENPDAHFGLAEVLLKQNKRAEAAVELQTYLTLAPDDDHSKDARKMLARLH